MTNDGQPTISYSCWLVTIIRLRHNEFEEFEYFKVKAVSATYGDHRATLTGGFDFPIFTLFCSTGMEQTDKRTYCNIA